MLAVLSACASGTSPVYDTLSAVVEQHSADEQILPKGAQVNPQYRYLRVQIHGHPPALLVLGYVDEHPLGAIEVWYSSMGEVIKLQNGRIVASAGLGTDWTALRFTSPPPAWLEASVKVQSNIPSNAQSNVHLNAPNNSMHYARERDTMPTYRYGIQESVQVQAWDTLPPVELAPSLPADVARSYHWFRERSSSAANAADTVLALPDAWFAWGKHQGQWMVVYSEQCLAPDLCISLQRWPLQEEAQ